MRNDDPAQILEYGTTAKNQGFGQKIDAMIAPLFRHWKKIATIPLIIAVVGATLDRIGSIPSVYWPYAVSSEMTNDVEVNSDSVTLHPRLFIHADFDRRVPGDNVCYKCDSVKIDGKAFPFGASGSVWARANSGGFWPDVGIPLALNANSRGQTVPFEGRVDFTVYGVDTDPYAKSGEVVVAKFSKWFPSTITLPPGTAIPK